MCSFCGSTQYIIELEEIKQYTNEIIWDFDQILKTLIARVSFEISGIQHKEYFIAELLTHIRLQMMQKNIATWSEALDIFMKLETSPVVQNAIGMSQIQMQLVNLTLQLQDIKMGKEQHEDIQCTRCRT